VYDRVQRRIRYNHAALGPPGWGRAGADVSLRLDAAVEVVRDGAVAARADDNATADDVPAAEETQRMKKKTLKVRGREIEIRADSDDGMVEAQSAVTELENKANADAAELAAGYRARIRNHGHSCFLCEIVIRSQFHTTYEPEA
jgi:hypothetical protein